MVSFSKLLGITRGLLILTLIAQVLVGCAPGIASPTPEPKGGGGDFRVVFPVEPKSLNPDLRSDDASFAICQNIFNKLVTLDADYHVIPDLAETWDVSDDGLTYTFHLAENARWHDGQPLTSADVKWTFETIVSGNGVRKDTAERIASIETPDTTTVIMKLKTAWSPFLPTIAWYGTFILPEHIYEGSDWTTNPANQKPVGSGPFKFVEWIAGDKITLQANPEYFKRGPFLDRIVYRILSDASKGVDLLMSKEADFLYFNLPRTRIAEMQGTPGIQVKTFPHPARFYLGFNLRRAPFDDLHVRQAINMAIDRTALVEHALLGYGATGFGFYTPLIAWAYNPKALAPAFDLTGAQALLDQAEIKPGADGIRLKINIVTINASPFTELASAVQEQLSAAGLLIEVINLAAPDFTQRVFTDHDFDLVLANGTQGPDPDNLEFRFGSKGSYQFMGYSNAEFDAAIGEGARLVKLEDRAQAYFRAQAILAQDLPIAPLVENVQFIITRDNVTGLAQTEARGLVTFQEFSLVRLK